MAQRIANKFPVDVQQKGIGISLNFSSGGVFASNYTTKDQIKSNLANYFLTNKGERIMDPDYGANLRAEIFEMVNSQTYDLLKSKVEAEIKANFPGVSVSNIEVLGLEDNSIIRIIITYNVIPFGINDELNLTFV